MSFLMVSAFLELFIGLINRKWIDLVGVRAGGIALLWPSGGTAQVVSQVRAPTLCPANLENGLWAWSPRTKRLTWAWSADWDPRARSGLAFWVLGVRALRPQCRYGASGVFETGLGGVWSGPGP